MKDKEKQIEELVGYIAKGINGVLVCEIINLAEHLTSLGYQKIDKDKQVVLSREEYEKINLCYNITRKETAREIFKALYSMRDVYAEHYEYEIRLNEYNLQELAKQYGVDLGEGQ